MGEVIALTGEVIFSNELAFFCVGLHPRRLYEVFVAVNIVVLMGCVSVWLKSSVLLILLLFLAGSISCNPSILGFLL